jgi:ribonuclease PH
LVVDCDVLQADGGTRVAAVTGSWVALYQALHNMVRAGILRRLPLKAMVAGVSVGIVGGEERLDLCYEEDAKAEVDFNVVMTDKGEFVEIQGTAEATPFSNSTINSLLNLAHKGITQLFQIQKQAIKCF